MGKSGCAVNNCQPDRNSSRHCFPNPEKFPNLFLLWVQLMANARLDNMDKNKIYTNCRVCGKHFTPQDYATNGYLKKNVQPTLYLPLPSVQNNLPHSSFTPDPLPSISLDHSYCKSTDVIDDERMAASTSATFLVSEAHSSPHVNCSGILLATGVQRSAELTPKAKKLYKQCVYFKRRSSILKKKSKTLRDRLNAAAKFAKEKSFANLCNNFSSSAFHFFKRQFECFGKHPKGRRYSIEDKIMALALYKQSPKAYRFLSTIFALPSRVTLHKLLARIPLAPGINFPVFEALKGMSKKMKPINKNCVLLFDEMALEPNLHYNASADQVEGLEDLGRGGSQKIANHAQVYMLRGIASNWKQPVGYFFVNGGVKASQIKENIISIIRAAKASGLNVVATICDQGTNNVSAINQLVMETRRNIGTRDYVFEVDGERIIPLFDAPHLLKAVRNNLLHKDIHFEKDGKKMTAKWVHIYKAWQIDGFSCDLRAMPKLTESHVNEKKMKKMKVSHCAQVFSHTVAATMNLLIGNSNLCEDPHLQLNEDARDTVEFLKFFDNLFDSVNGSAKQDTKGKPLRTSATTNGESIHTKYWKDAIPVIESMYILNNEGRKIVMPCFKNWVKTLSGFILLRKKLFNIGFRTLKCRRFNQDPLENFFGQIRQRGQGNTNPSCSAFIGIYKTLLVNDLVSKHPPCANCSDDGDNILIPLHRFITQGLPEPDQFEDHLDDRISTPPKSFSPLKPLETAALSYVAGYLAKVKLKLAHCEACKYNVFRRQGDNDNRYYCFIMSKEYGGKNSNRLKYCNVEFIQNLVHSYNLTKYIVSRFPDKKRLGELIVNTIKDNVDFNFIECAHSRALVDTTIREFSKLVIFNYFNGINKVLTGKDDRKLPNNPPLLVKEAANMWQKRIKGRTKYKK